MRFQKSGYHTRSLFSNVALGVVDGLDVSLWCYAFASIIFSGALSGFIPVGVAIILCGWAALGFTIIFTSKLRVHMGTLDEQAIVIIGGIGLILSAEFGADTGTARGLATMLAVMSVTTLSVAVVFYVSGKYQLAHLLELIPYPVICGFMAGIGWLLLDASVSVAIDAPISFDIGTELQQGNNALKLVLAVVGGLGLFFFTKYVSKSWALPFACGVILLVFYGYVEVVNIPVTELRAGGWLYEIQSESNGALHQLSGLSINDIDFGFVVSVMPQITTIAVLALLSASMNFSAISTANSKTHLRASDEMETLGLANLFCGLLCSPPGYSSATTSLLYQRFGATSRWVTLSSNLVCILVAVVGASLISVLPKVLICSTIFLFAIQMFYDWMYTNARSFSALDYLIVCTILAVVITMGFMQGVIVGVILSIFLFVLRYSMISAIQSQYKLNDHRSSVERSASCNAALNRHGSEALVYTLQGFLFFGTANSVRDSIRLNIDNNQYATICLDIRRVTGIDISALNTFIQIKEFCEAEGILVLYCVSSKELEEKILNFNVPSTPVNKPLIFSETDFALEYMEEVILSKYVAETVTGTIKSHLLNMLGNEEKVSLLASVMVRVAFKAGEYLFKQGETGHRFYMLESGSMSASIDIGNGYSKRVKKFSTGSVIGEMSGYTKDNTRSASVMADEASILYCFDPEKLNHQHHSRTEILAAIHELVARTMGARVEYMNRRLMMELR